LWDSSRAIQAARESVTDLFDRLQPCLRTPRWSDLSEEYFVFEFPPLAAAAARAER